MLNSSSAKWLGLLAGAAMTLLAFIGSVMLGTTPLEWSALWRMLTAYDPAFYMPSACHAPWWRRSWVLAWP